MGTRCRVDLFGAASLKVGGLERLTAAGCAYQELFGAQQAKASAVACADSSFLLGHVCRLGRGADGAAAADFGADARDTAGGRVPQRQAPQHAQGHRLHRLPLPQGQDLAASHPPRPAHLPGQHPAFRPSPGRHPRHGCCKYQCEDHSKHGLLHVTLH